jgi:hypothetical protein
VLDSYTDGSINCWRTSSHSSDIAIIHNSIQSLNSAEMNRIRSVQTGRAKW